MLLPSVWQPSVRRGWRTPGLLRVPKLPFRALGRPQTWLVPVRLELLPVPLLGKRREVSSRRAPQSLMRRNGRIRPAPAVWLLHLLK